MCDASPCTNREEVTSISDATAYAEVERAAKDVAGVPDTISRILSGAPAGLLR